MVIELEKKILIRFGDLMLKGRNIRFFLKQIKLHIKEKLKDKHVQYETTHDRIYISYDNQDESEIINRLKQIPGIYSMSVIYLASKEIDHIVDVSIKVINKTLKTNDKTFKIETKRADKSFYLTSLELTKKIAPMILKGIDLNLKVDVKHPDETLHVEVRRDQTFIYISSILGMGGYPYATGGKGLMMMSGGIDSPVASYLAMKQGIDLELMHFESTPLTPLESAQKVIDLAKKLSKYTLTNKIKVHMIPFGNLHEALLKHVYDPYIITVMRRMMYRIAEIYAKQNDILVLLNGESVGQVASQTLESMSVVEAVTKMPILRPLITYDKNDIITIAKHIDTFDISIRPFNDCCSIYVPRNPVIKPKEHLAINYENKFDYQAYIDDAISRVMTFEISNDFNMKLYEHGFSVKDAYEEYLKKRMNEFD